MGTRIRLVLIAALLLLSVVVDSVYYLVSAMTDGIFVVGIVLLGWPMVKKLLNE